MKKKKLNLNDLNVESFVTSQLGITDQTPEIIGGATIGANGICIQSIWPPRINGGGQCNDEIDTKIQDLFRSIRESCIAACHYGEGQASNAPDYKGCNGQSYGQ